MNIIKSIVFGRIERRWYLLKNNFIIKGIGLNTKNAIGKIHNIKHDPNPKENTIIVTERLTYNLYMDLKKINIKGIITDYGGLGSHIAIIAKQNKLPAVLGVYLQNNKKATDILNSNDLVILNSKDGIIKKLNQEELFKILINNEPF
ncbi:PEP-utilizing enzyme [Candidatus Frackibacter sp. WG13]|uniref:PEP-utilizing enzyme n=1 Tax=Candidatus Frackibacter sp. WG13 TaxID=2017978 RepID=UPI000B7EC9CF|nr:PEP-utilizing enzyme [Candidatus Frackibacter sp. WG13]